MVALLTIATGKYKGYIHDLIASAYLHIPEAKIYVFTDKPKMFEGYKNVESIKIPNVGWPEMPLLRFECYCAFKGMIKEKQIFSIDAEALFVDRITPEVFEAESIGVLHRNIMRFRKDFHYENNPESKAFIGEEEGEKYFACGLVGGSKEYFWKLAETLTENIREDIKKGIRAIWGDESHLNRFYIDNQPKIILPPSFMCPEENFYFKPIIVHQNKSFKCVFRRDMENYRKINPNNYNIKFR